MAKDCKVEGKILATAGILTREQMIAELGVTSDTLLNWEDNEDFPHKKVGRTTLYDVEAIRRWMNEK